MKWRQCEGLHRHIHQIVDEKREEIPNMFPISIMMNCVNGDLPSPFQALAPFAMDTNTYYYDEHKTKINIKSTNPSIWAMLSYISH